jgi:peptidyl-prolyl cis-trans isomerase C
VAVPVVRTANSRLTADNTRQGNEETVNTYKVAVTAVLLAVGLACQKAPSQSQQAGAAAKPSATPPQQAASTPSPQATAAGATTQSAQPAQPAPPTFKPVPPQLPAVVARVNGEAISGTELEQAVRALESQVGQPVPIERRDQVYRQMIDQLIAFRLLAQASAARGLVVTNGEIDARLTQIRQQFPNEQAFLAALGQQKMTLDKLRAQTRSQMLVARMIDMEIAPKVAVAEKDISAFYEQNKGKFNEPEAVHLSHILIRLPSNPDVGARAKARAQAVDLLKQLKAGGDFATLARQFSQDQGSAPNGGDLGFVVRGQTMPAFETVAFTLKPGELSGVVETQVGYHIIKGLEHRPARQVPLAEATPRISQYLTEQQRQQKTTVFIEGLKTKAKVEILI